MNTKKIIKYFIVAVVFVALGYLSAVYFSLNPQEKEEKEAAATITNEKSAGKILGEEGSASSADASRMFVSDNFRSSQITFGGDAIALPSGEQSVAPEIINMRSELLMTKTDEKVKFVLTWETNKLCRSSIEYMREGQAEGKKVSEDGYGFIHSVEIAPLNYSTSYSYKVSARDKWGNESVSDKLAFYTGAPNVSIFDLLGGAFKNMFGR